MRTATAGAIRPNEITVTKCGTYYNGGHDYSVTFVLDYATITVSIEHDQDIETEDDGDGIVVGSDSDAVENAIAAAAAIQLYDYYGLVVGVPVSDDLRCPVCGGVDVTGDSWDMVTGAAWQDVSCDDCGSSWTDCYGFTGRQDIRQGDRVEIARARQAVRS